MTQTFHSARNLFGPLLLLCALHGLSTRARAVTLEQIISRENPLYDNRGAEMVVGRDGLVYLHSHVAYNGYTTRLTREGKEKTGGDSGPATGNIAANSEGVIAAANQHFTHAVGLHDKNFVRIGGVSDFVSWTPEFGEASGYNDPARVEVGASGDFYAVDQFRDRILRIAVPGKVVKSYLIPRAGAGIAALTWDFRVNEKTETFYTRSRATDHIRAVGFDGKTKWTTPMDTSGGWDVDDNGILYAIGSRSSSITKQSGQAVAMTRFSGHIPGEGDFKTSLAKYPITSLRVYKDEVLIKRAHPTETFLRFDLNSGNLKQAVTADFEKLTVTFPDEVWTAGQPVAFSIEHSDPIHNAKPQWRVWARSLSLPDYRELKVVDGNLQVPSEAAGIYQIKVTPEAQPWQRGTASEYLVRSWVEIRVRGSQGTVNVLTPDNRAYYARGEAIPFGVLLRGAKAPEGKPLPVTVRLMEAPLLTATPGKPPRVLAEAKATTTIGQRLQLAVPASLTGALAPGRYLLSAGAPGLTGVAQPLVIGSASLKSPFDLVQYGDYQQPGFFPIHPAANAWTTPDLTAAHVDRLGKLGVTMVVERLGHNPGEVSSERIQSEVEALRARLAADPLAVAPEKSLMAGSLLQTMAGLSAAGISQMDLLLYMDAGLPAGTGFDKRTPEQFAQAITTVTQALLPYAAFRGWSWAANWWIFDANLAFKTPKEKTDYQAALKKAKETGAWDPILETVAERKFAWQADAQEMFNAALRKVAPAKVTASSGPYRRPEAYPPVVFRNVDEVDLQYQAEQIQPPDTTWHNVDYQKRSGKHAWGHPELFNDVGTGDQIVPSLFAMTMRGADGVGHSGPIPAWGVQPEDARSAYYGTASVFRAAYGLLRQYGPWLAGLQKNDRVAIVVSGRMARIDDWKGIGGQYFTRLFEAYQSCLYAHYPASFVFTEDLKPDSLNKFKAVLVVGQTVEFDPALSAALSSAKAKGAAIFADGTCRPELVKEFKPLGLTFDKVENDPSVWQDDSAYWRFATYFVGKSAILKEALAPVLPPVAGVENPEVLLSERAAEDGRYLFMVNNTVPLLEPGQLWRMTKAISTRVPVQVPVKLAAADKAVYDVFAMRQVTPQNGGVQADLRTLPARLFAVLPGAIKDVELRGPQSVAAGQPFAWSVGVRDATGKLIRASIPVRLRLVDGSGVVEERFLSADSKAAAGRMRAPLNALSGALTLEATELISGQSARLNLALTPAALPIKLGPQSDDRVAAAAAIGKSMVATPLKPLDQNFGPHIRDIVVTDNGALAVMNTMNWDHNLYGVDVATGKVRWRQRAGNEFAFAPQALKAGFAVQGFDFNTPEGYHLYLAGNDGTLERRFALYGLPKGLPNWAFPAVLQDRINNFATSADGGWIASAGDLGLAIWSRAGKLLWSQDWRANRHTAVLAALDTNSLLVAEGMTATAYDASSGQQKWQIKLAANGEIRGAQISRDGSTLAVRTTADSGRIYVLRGGKLVTNFLTPVEDLAISDDGSLLALTTANQLKVYDVAGGLLWSFSGDDTLHFPRFASGTPSGSAKRLAVSSELGTAYVLEHAGKPLLEKDMGALAVPAWLPGGDLLLGTWMGTVTRLDQKYGEKWRTLLQPTITDMQTKFLAAETVSTTRVVGWSNATAAPAPLMPNLLEDASAIISIKLGDQAVELENKAADLVDGKPDAPAKPWLPWSTVNMIDSGWRGSASMILDTFNTQLRVTGITFVEDAAHPESWLRDANLEYWDAAKEEWVFAQSLLSDAPAHTHQLPRPFEAARFRLVKSPTSGTWPVGNIRLGEIVVHGEKLGASHPDVVAKRRRAVLFDEGEELKTAMTGLTFKFDDAYSGGRSLLVESNAGATYTPPFGHALPNWDFEIVENPEPGQYRYLQFAWQSLSPQTTAMSLLIGNPWPGGGVSVAAGHKALWNQGVIVEKKVSDKLLTEWQTVRVDLWELLKKPIRLKSMSLATAGGPAAFDQVVLGRTEADLPVPKQ